MLHNHVEYFLNQSSDFYEKKYLYENKYFVEISAETSTSTYQAKACMHTSKFACVRIGLARAHLRTVLYQIVHCKVFKTFHNFFQVCPKVKRINPKLCKE